jgi:hypothetical protein
MSWRVDALRFRRRAQSVGLAGDDNGALKQHFLNQAQAQGETVSALYQRCAKERAASRRVPSWRNLLSMDITNLSDRLGNLVFQRPAEFSAVAALRRR